MDTRAEKLNSIIADGSIKVPSILQEIQEEWDRREDIIAKPEAFKLTVGNEIGCYVRNENCNFYTFTRHARNQLLARTKIPVAFADNLLNMGEPKLLENNLNILHHRLNDDGLLLRRVDEQIKGVLSPSYRRMDGAPIIHGFVESALQAGYVPYTGTNTDYRYNICFILPEVFQPSENEFIVLGISITTGDYGSCALQIELVVLRITCRNLMLGTDVMRSVHIGKRFNMGEESIISISNETHDLDNRAVASMVSDAVKSSIDLQGGVRQKITNSMQDVPIDINVEIAKMRKKGFSKELAESVKATYDAPLPVVSLPQDKNKWRLANAISLLANQDGIAKDLALDLQKLAMATL
jgi:hypothetical protein|tara:strand:- start:11077 stop:12135 length:1059 start_codon:yes stop_codon:yes gene_type:complete